MTIFTVDCFQLVVSIKRRIGFFKKKIRIISFIIILYNSIVCLHNLILSITLSFNSIILNFRNGRNYPTIIKKQINSDKILICGYLTSL